MFPRNNNNTKVTAAERQRNLVATASTTTDEETQQQLTTESWLDRYYNGDIIGREISETSSNNGDEHASLLWPPPPHQAKFRRHSRHLLSIIDDDEDDDNNVQQHFVAKTKIMKVVSVLSMLDTSGDTTVLWKDLPDTWKNDTDIAMAAWRNLWVRKAPPCLSRDVILRELQIESDERPVSWDQVPTDLQRDGQFFRSVLRFLDCGELELAGQEHPHLFNEREVWNELLQSSALDEGVSVDFVRVFAPEVIKRDREVMLHIVERHPRAFHIVHESLRRDETFVRIALETNALVLQYLFPHEHRMFPELVKAALEPFGKRPYHERRLTRLLPREFWGDRDFALAYFKAGLNYDRQIHPDDFRTDQEIFLLISLHCSDNQKIYSFSHASPLLKGNKDFMMQVVHNDARLIHCASAKLKQDFDLVLMAMAGYPVNRIQEVPPFMRSSLHVHREYFRKIQAGLEDHKLFVQNILCAIGLGDPHCCSLTLLNQGQTTSEGYKKLIASYLGIPAGTNLKLYRQAAAKFSHVFP